MRRIRSCLIFLFIPIVCLFFDKLSYGTELLKVSTENSRYFNQAGKPQFLIGVYATDYLFHPDFNCQAYFDRLAASGINYTRFWSEWTNPNARGATRDGRSMREDAGTIIYPWPRTGPGTDYLGQLKFDLSQHNPAWFQRLRDMISYANAKGIYCQIILFDAWSGKNVNNAWDAHRFNGNNNINGIDGGGNSNWFQRLLKKSSYVNTNFTMSNPQITAIQDAYVRRLIDEVNEFDNVTYEIANEGGSAAWHQHMIDLIQEYENSKPKQHLVCTNDDHTDHKGFADPKTDYVSNHRNYRWGDEAPWDTGIKPVIGDTDWGVLDGNDVRMNAWRSLVCGAAAFSWLEIWTLNSPSVKYQGLDNDIPEYKWISYLANFVRNIDFAKAGPDDTLVSSGECLANPEKGYVIYLENGGSTNVNLSAISGTLSVEWLNPRSGEVTEAGTVNRKGWNSFTAPDANDWVLHISRTSPDTTPPAALTESRVE